SPRVRWPTASTNTPSCKPICHYYGPATRTDGSTPGASTSSPKPHETPSPIQPATRSWMKNWPPGYRGEPPTHPDNYAPGSADQSPTWSPRTTATAHTVPGTNAAPASPTTMTAPHNYSRSCRAKTASPSTT